MEISYSSEPTSRWNKALDEAATLADLRLVATFFKRIASDAKTIIDAMSEADFIEFRVGLAKERRRAFSGEAWAEKFSAVVMPALMFRVGMVALHFGVPWGLAFIRLKESGKITEADGIAKYVDL